ncbi:MAG: AAA family ATPase [Candidatus Firestonebacteria bacterium]
MIKRTFWQKSIKSAWKRHSVIWLSGVRRVGKTFLCRDIEGADYYDCELPSIREKLANPEKFLNENKGRVIVLDEIHRLSNPSELLKIAADYYPNIKVIATGSSTLGASSKFKDTLTGRKSNVWMTPMIYKDIADFSNISIKYRMLKGGLPPFFMAKTKNEKDYQDWIDSYWAKDVQELFMVGSRYSFQKFLELLIYNSGGMFEANKYAIPCEVSRGTISNYLKILEATYVIAVIKPFNSHKSTEIVSAPKIYVFDTGFISYYKGWNDLRNENCGILWEHIILNEILAISQRNMAYYWRNKKHNEIDFVIPLKNKNQIIIECKWSYSSFDPVNIVVFRKIYPVGDNIVVLHNIKNEFFKNINGIKIRFINLKDLENYLLSIYPE